MKVWDECYWLLYDTLTLPTTSISEQGYKMFGESLGHSKGIQDTNLCQDGRLEDPESYSIHGLTLVCKPTADKLQYDRFIENYAIDLWIGQKTYLRAPGGIFGYFGTPDQMAELIRNTKRLIYKDEGVCPPTQGLIEFPKDRELVIPYYLSFALTLRSNKSIPLYKSIDLYAIMWGIIQRGVQ